jgi:hypothetical protein
MRGYNTLAVSSSTACVSFVASSVIAAQLCGAPRASHQVARPVLRGSAYQPLRVGSVLWRDVRSALPAALRVR